MIISMTRLLAFLLFALLASSVQFVDIRRVTALEILHPPNASGVSAMFRRWKNPKQFSLEKTFLRNGRSHRSRKDKCLLPAQARKFR